MRTKFVNHEGKKEIEISRPNFVKGSDKNEWEGVFPELSDKIDKNSVEGTVKLIECNFTTTGAVEKVVSKFFDVYHFVEGQFSIQYCSTVFFVVVRSKIVKILVC